MGNFLEVTSQLANGFLLSCILFLLTLILALPLGLLISFCTMSKWKPIKYVFKVFVWIIRGVPLMLQVIIAFYVPGFLFGTPLLTRFAAVIVAFVTFWVDGTLLVAHADADGIA